MGRFSNSLIKKTKDLIIANFNKAIVLSHFKNMKSAKKCLTKALRILRVENVFDPKLELSLKEELSKVENVRFYSKF